MAVPPSSPAAPRCRAGGRGITQLEILAQQLVDAIQLDDTGMVVAEQFVGGNGGLLSRETLKVADAVRLELDRLKPSEVQE